MVFVGLNVEEGALRNVTVTREFLLEWSPTRRSSRSTAQVSLDCLKSSMHAAT